MRLTRCSCRVTGTSAMRLRRWLAEQWLLLWLPPPLPRAPSRFVRHLSRRVSGFFVHVRPHSIASCGLVPTAFGDAKHALPPARRAGLPRFSALLAPVGPARRSRRRPERCRVDPRRALRPLHHSGGRMRPMWWSCYHTRGFSSVGGALLTPAASLSPVACPAVGIRTLADKLRLQLGSRTDCSQANLKWRRADLYSLFLT